MSETVADRLALHGVVTGDESTNIIDASQIARFAVGLDVAFQIELSIGRGWVDSQDQIPVPSIASAAEGDEFELGTPR